MSEFVRIRGLPYSARADDILDFFKDVKIKGGKRGIFFPQGPNGRSNGEAFLELETRGDVDRAVSHHNEHMGSRYIEVFHSDSKEMEHAMGRGTPDHYPRREHVVRLRGLPYDTEKKEIYAFFNGLDIAPNGIGLLVDHMGRCTGEAYVQFTSSESLDRAKEKHMEKIGHRYIEIFESTMMEANMTIQRQMEINCDRCANGGPAFGRGFRGHPGRGYYDYPRGGGRGPPPGRYAPYGRPSSFGYSNYDAPRVPAGDYMRGFNSTVPEEEPSSVTGHSIRLRGLPFSATMEDIGRFLAPLQPVNVRILYNSAGRPTGEAVADFASHDEAKEAMKKDREKIGSRYIELFLDSTPMGNNTHRGGNVGSSRRSLSPYSSNDRRFPAYPNDNRHYADRDWNDERHPDEYGYYSNEYNGSEYDARPPPYYNRQNTGPMGPAGDGYMDYRYRNDNYW